MYWRFGAAEAAPYAMRSFYNTFLQYIGCLKFVTNNLLLTHPRTALGKMMKDNDDDNDILSNHDDCESFRPGITATSN